MLLLQNFGLLCTCMLHALPRDVVVKDDVPPCYAVRVHCCSLSRALDSSLKAYQGAQQCTRSLISDLVKLKVEALWVRKRSDDYFAQV